MLTKNLVRAVKDHPRQLDSGPVKAGQMIYVGSVLCYDAAGLIVRGITNAVRVAGVCVEQAFPEDPKANNALDNTVGSSGAWNGDTYDRGVRFDTVGEYRFTNITGTPKPGGAAYPVDDDAMSTTPSSSSLVIGRFTQRDRVGWLVDIARKNDQVRPAVTMAVQAAVAGAQEVKIQLVDELGDDLPVGKALDWYLAEDAAGLLHTTTAANGGVAAGTSGSAVETVAGVAGLGTTGADGALDLVVSHSLNKSFYLVAIVDGLRVVSGELIPTPA